jgi:hypothetical protein
MSNDTKPNQAGFVAGMQALSAGMQKHFPNGQLTFGNAVHTTDSIVEILQDLVGAYSAVDAANATATDAVAARRAKQANAAPVIRDLVAFLRATFRDATAQLGGFGLQAPKARTPISTDTRVVARAKAKATRTARGTTSKKQKLAVHGDVTDVLMTPVTPSGPAPSPAQAPVPAPAGPATPPAAK